MLTMHLSINQKQNYLYVSLMILTIAAAIFSYRTLQTKWILIREAENKFMEKSFPEAIALYQKSMKEGLTTQELIASNSIFHLADSYNATGNFSESIKYYRLYLDKYPDDDNVRLLLARVLSWSGNFKEAEKEYQKALGNSHEKHSF